MTTNVSIEYANALAKFENAKTPSEKLAALEEMRSHCPTHKGAEAMRAGINKKIATLKAEMDAAKKQASKQGGGPSIAVKKDGIGQIAIIGLPNSGKSTFFNAMTGLSTPVGDYEFTTTKPEVGMVDFKGAKIQLVDMPPIVEGSSEGKVNGKELLAVVRNADAVVLVIPVATQDEDYRILSSELEKSGILLDRKKPNISIVQSTFPGISITGKEFLKVPLEEFMDFLKNTGYYNAQIILREPTTLDMMVEIMDTTLVYKRSMIVYVKGTPKQRVAAREGAMHIAWSTQNPRPAEMTDKFFEILDKVFVFTKKPGQEASKMPLVAPKGSTILDVATLVHKDIVSSLKYAKIWGSAKFEGQRVTKDYEVQNGDIVEFNW